jgi:hypothetical protein
MSTRNERLNESFASLDEMADRIDFENSIVFSDRCKGARKIRGEDTESELDELEINKLQQKKLREAVTKLTNANKKHLIPVLLQVTKNGKNRKESFWQLSRIWKRKLSGTRREYYRGVKELLMLFSSNKNRGKTHF